eukprot:4491404-Prymnesium_polylepis.1
MRGACRCVSSRAMVTINSEDLGVRANTLQYITPWPGDKITAHHTTLEEPQVPQHRVPKQRSRSLALSRESARTYRQR